MRRSGGCSLRGFTRNIGERFKLRTAAVGNSATDVWTAIAQRCPKRARPTVRRLDPVSAVSTTWSQLGWITISPLRPGDLEGVDQKTAPVRVSRHPLAPPVLSGSLGRGPMFIDTRSALRRGL